MSTSLRYVDQLNDKQVTILYLYWMFLHNKFTTDTLHSGSSFTMSFLKLIGRNSHTGPPSPFDLADMAQELVDKYAIKERTQIVFTPCDGSPVDKRNKRGRKYWVVESNDPRFPLGSKVRRDSVDKVQKTMTSVIRVGFGECPTWCPHCNNNLTTLWYRIANYITG